MVERLLTNIHNLETRQLFLTKYERAYWHDIRNILE